MRREQTARYLANDTTTRVYKIALIAPTCDKQHRFYKTVNAFLAADDDTLRDRFRAAKWRDFEWAPLRLWSPSPSPSTSPSPSPSPSLSPSQSRARARVAVESWAHRRRVISSSRRLAAMPPSRRGLYRHAPHYYVTRPSYAVMSRCNFDFLCTMYSSTVLILLSSLSLPVAARIFAFPSQYSTHSSRGRAHCYRIPSLRIRWAFALNWRRVVTVRLCVAHRSRLNECHYLA